jgi:hypothetical protein
MWFRRTWIFHPQSKTVPPCSSRREEALTTVRAAPPYTTEPPPVACYVYEIGGLTRKLCPEDFPEDPPDSKTDQKPNECPDRKLERRIAVDEIFHRCRDGAQHSERHARADHHHPEQRFFVRRVVVHRVQHTAAARFRKSKAGRRSSGGRHQRCTIDLAGKPRCHVCKTSRCRLPPQS